MSTAVKSLLSLSVISLMTIGLAGCGHEALVTGPTQCFAPRDVSFNQATTVAQTQPQPVAQTTVASTSL